MIRRAPLTAQAETRWASRRFSATEQQERMMAGIGFWGGFPTKHVLEKLGAELRQAYLPVLEASPPEAIRALLARPGS